MQLENWTEAAKLYHQAARLQPDNYQVWHNLAAAYQHLNTEDDKVREASSLLVRCIFCRDVHNVLCAMSRRAYRTMMREYGMPFVHYPYVMRLKDVEGQVVPGGSG